MKYCRYCAFCANGDCSGGAIIDSYSEVYMVLRIIKDKEYDYESIIYNSEKREA